MPDQTTSTAWSGPYSAYERRCISLLTPNKGEQIVNLEHGYATSHPEGPQEHVMLDLETFGTSPGCAIASIGAVRFTQEGIGSQFYQNVDIESCVECGLTIDPKTMMWWMQQEDEARSALFDGPHPLRDALCRFTAWFGTAHCTHVWGNGSNFDNEVLKWAFKVTGVICPWTYKDDRCFRTMKSLFPSITHEFTGVKHNAVADAQNQAEHLIKIFQHLDDYGIPYKG